MTCSLCATAFSPLSDGSFPFFANKASKVYLDPTFLMQGFTHFNVNDQLYIVNGINRTFLCEKALTCSWPGPLRSTSARREQPTGHQDTGEARAFDQNRDPNPSADDATSTEVRTG